MLVSRVMHGRLRRWVHTRTQTVVYLTIVVGETRSWNLRDRVSMLSATTLHERKSAYSVRTRSISERDRLAKLASYLVSSDDSVRVYIILRERRFVTVVALVSRLVRSRRL